MIITILGADFSASNIGTLSSYLVRYTGNVTGNVTSVEKNDAGTSAKNALSATITMKSGFTYESLSVTVGGSTITGYTATDNGNGTVSLTVPANLITGTVVVSVVTTGSSVNPPSGEPEEPGTGGGSGETPIAEYILNKNIFSDGELTDSSGLGRIAVITYFPTNGKEPSVTSDIRTVIIAKRYYDSDKKSVSTASGSSYCRIVLVINNSSETLKEDVYNGKTVTVNNIVYTLKSYTLESDTPLKLKYSLNTNINADGKTEASTGRFCILDYIPTGGTTASAKYSNPNYAESIGVAYRYYLEDKTTMSPNGANGSAYARLVFYNGTAESCTEDNIENTTIVINGVTYTLSNK